MEKFSIRHEKEKFVEALYSIKLKVEVSSFEKTPSSLALKVVDLRNLITLCKEQSLTTIGQISPVRELTKYANYLDTMVMAGLVDRDKQVFDESKSLFVKNFSSFVEGIEKSLNILVVKIKDRIENEDYNGSYDNNAKIEETLSELHHKFETEVEKINNLKPVQANQPVLVRGSVAIHQFFTNLKLDHSTVRFGGIKYSNSNRSEITTPITVLHNQTLLMVKLRAYKFHFRKEPLSIEEIADRKSEAVNAIKFANFKDLDVDMSAYVSGGVLISKKFKGYSFIWFMQKSDFIKLEHIPENKAYLMWE